MKNLNQIVKINHIQENLKMIVVKKYILLQLNLIKKINQMKNPRKKLFKKVNQKKKKLKKI